MRRVALISAPRAIAGRCGTTGRHDEGYAKYQEVVDKHFAAPSYRNVRRWLAERK
jgi:hypothetical protein